LCCLQLQLREMLHLRYHRGQSNSTMAVAICFHTKGDIAFLSSSTSIAIYDSSISRQAVFADADAALSVMQSTDSLIVAGDVAGHCYGFSWTGGRLWKRQILDEVVQHISPLLELDNDFYFFAASSRDVAFHSTKSRKTVRELLSIPSNINVVDASAFGCLVGTSDSAFVLSASGETAVMKAVSVTAILDLSPMGFAFGTSGGDLYRIDSSGITKRIVNAHSTSITNLACGYESSVVRILSTSAGQRGIAVAWTGNGERLWSVGGDSPIVMAVVAEGKSFVAAATKEGSITLHRWDGAG
jgi:hypothetical protein